MGLEVYAKNLLEDKTCDNCSQVLFCAKKNKILYNTCVKWQAKTGFEEIIKIIRQAYPNIVNSKSVSISPMEKPDYIIYDKKSN